MSRDSMSPPLAAEPARAATLGSRPELAPRAGLNGTFLSPYDASAARPALGLLGAFRHEPAAEPWVEGLSLQAARPAPPADPPRPRPEAIIDRNNLLPFDFLRTGDRVGRAVVKLQRADGASGTGFLVAPGVLLTNHHVLPDPTTAAGTKAVANDETQPPADPAGRPAVAPLEPHALFLTNAELDFTFCAVAGLDHLGMLPLSRNSLGIMPSECVNIIQHPRGRTKEVALQDNRVVKADNVVLHYTCDTEPGSSGSPVFNNQWRLVALHHASVPAAHTGEGRGGSTLRYLNEGIRLSAIALWLESLQGDPPVDPEQLARVRSMFVGLDPQVGFFGALGRRAAGDSAAAAVLDCYRRDDEFDIAFWDLAPLRGRFREHRDDVGRVVAEMGLDLWCLGRIWADAAADLVAHLRDRFDREYRAAFVGTPEAGHVAFLVRAEPGPTGRTPTVQPRDAGLYVEAETRRGAIAFVAIPAACRIDPDPVPAADCIVGGAVADVLPWAAQLERRAHVARGDDGAIAWLAREDSPIHAAFVSPNVPDLSPSGRLVVATHRHWPAPLRGLPVGRPLALRLLVGERPKPMRPLADAASSPSAAPPPEPGAGFDPDLERLLDSILRPIVARIVAETRRG